MTPAYKWMAKALERFSHAGGNPAANEQIRMAVTRAIKEAQEEAIAEEREACAKLVLDGGDGQDRLETAIQYGPNAAIAEAILARGQRSADGIAARQVISKPGATIEVTTVEMPPAVCDAISNALTDGRARRNPGG